MSAFVIPPGDAIALTKALVAIDSRNPLLVRAGPGEPEVAALLLGVLAAWGFRAESFEAAPLRTNVVARIGANTTGKSLMFNGHLDVVGIEGMTHPPFTPNVVDGLLYGRGSADMKGGIAAMCAAAWRAAQQGLQGEIIIAAVADEEFTSLGTRSILARGIRADAAIVTEPTKLAIMPAHRGFAFLEVDVRGKAAHGSRYDVGVDAILHAGLLLADIDRLEREILPESSHSLLGRPSIHASFIEGGTGMSTYPDRCVLKLERRTLPGETPAHIQAQIEAACERVKVHTPNFDATVRMLMDQGPSDVSVDAPIVRALCSSLREANEPVAIAGMSAWTDAALLNDAGIPAICFGPGDISLAHAAEEYIPLGEIERATTVLARLAASWCN